VKTINRKEIFVMNKKREIVVKMILAIIAVIVTALFVAAINTVLDGLHIENRKKNTYYVHISEEYHDTKRYSDTWNGQKIIEIDGHPIKDGETVKILVK
jgi:uncharacterized protein YxeA